MSFSELIGLIIMLLVMGLSVFRRSYETPAEGQGRRSRPRTGSQEQKNDLLRQLLASMDLEDEMGPAPRRQGPPPVPAQAAATPPPAPQRQRFDEGVREQVVRDFEFHASIEDRHQSSAIESRHVDSAIDGRSAEDFINQRIQNTGQDVAYKRRGKRKRTSKARHLIQGSSLRDAIVISEVLGKPVSLREL